MDHTEHAATSVFVCSYGDVWCKSSNTYKYLHMTVSAAGIVKSNDKNNEHKFSPHLSA
jgi:hypothetical protein